VAVVRACDPSCTGFKWEAATLVPLSGSPAARSNHTLVPIGDAVYLFGGAARGIRFNDVWALRQQLPSPGGECKALQRSWVPPSPDSWSFLL
jgi:hypothetical protein